jgi:hypothetical protein
MIRNRERNFAKYIEKHFAMELPQGIELFYTKGVRVGNGKLRPSGLNGELGYAACDFGFNPTNSFIQNFGHLAKKNIVRLNEDEGRKFAAGENLSIDLGKKTKNVIVTCKGHTLGLGLYESEKKRIVNKIPEKRRRKIVNSIS